MTEAEEEEIWRGLIGLVVFLGTWAYCAYTYGFLFGFGLGWLPAAILAGLAALLWRLVLFVVGCIVVYALYLWRPGHG